MIKIHNDEPIRTSTPKQNLSTGYYNAVIAAIIYPKGNQNSAEYILQVHTGSGINNICYVPTVSFKLTLDPRFNLYKLLAGLSGTETVDDMAKWMREQALTELGNDGMFDERSLVGKSIGVYIELQEKISKQGRKVNFSVVTGFVPSLGCEPKAVLDTSKLIPSTFGEPRYTIEKDASLEIDKPYVRGKRGK